MPTFSLFFSSVDPVELDLTQPVEVTFPEADKVVRHVPMAPPTAGEAGTTDTVQVRRQMSMLAMQGAFFARVMITNHSSLPDF